MIQISPYQQYHRLSWACFVEGFAGCNLWAPRVILVATQADGGVEGDPEGLLTELQQHYDSDLIIEPHVFVVDSANTSSSEMTALKRAIASIKQFVCEVREFDRYPVYTPWPVKTFRFILHYNSRIS